MSEEMTPELRREVVNLAVRYIDEMPHREVMKTLKKASISKERRENLRVFRDALTVASASDDNVGSYVIAYDILKAAKLI
jgi:hypothetical protein